MIVRRLGRAVFADRRGASAVEFALVAPVLFAFIMLLIEGGRMEWTRQAIQEVAVNTARCMAVGKSECASNAQIIQYARSRGRDWGVSLTAATITPSVNQTCNAVAGMRRVDINLPYRTVVALLFPGVPRQLRASACFPAIT
ncbi:TadE/TadG family type IV pilus assembly protein [Sphingomonas colocasiae]|uniref:Pilus assembly protein n=1 Tax=Sphingomonas colocasiae TaxID=1848973 RepID=A0ABS7PJ01_9SPHN|nr:TadE/TadG family type IV pilus assembly protein [Sphingomonas colocasiae]MBY8821277.1 pilus assembly protein [Sphingomonas colocasiae]